MTDADTRGDAEARADLLVVERRTPKGLLVAACDAHLLGESFAEGDLTLDVTEEFYGGDRADEDAVRDSLRRASVANLVGDRTVALAVEAGLVDRDRVLVVEGVPHAQFMRM